MKLRRVTDEKMPARYYVLVIVVLLAITFMALYLAGETDSLWDFMKNLRKAKTT